MWRSFEWRHFQIGIINHESRLLFLLKLHSNRTRFSPLWPFCSVHSLTFELDFTVALETFSCAYTITQLESNFIEHNQCMVIVLLTCVLYFCELRHHRSQRGDPMLCVRECGLLDCHTDTYNGSETCFFSLSVIFVIFNAIEGVHICVTSERYHDDDRLDH